VRFSSTVGEGLQDLTTLEVVQLPARPNEWDRDIQGFATKTLFHESAWLDFVQTIHPRGRIEYFAILQGGTVAGYFCVVRVNKAMWFPVYGSPLPDAGMYMGPLVNDHVAQAELVQALVGVCRLNMIASLELANDWLDSQLMRRLGFKVYTNLTNICSLPWDEPAAWAALKGTCRTRIRKAEKSGLEAEMTDDVAIVDDFYRYFTHILQRKGRQPRYGIERPRSLMACLTPADRLFSVQVKYEGRVIGVAFYPHDDRSMYYWDGASDLDHLELCPNELLHWTAMKEAIRRRIPLFNIGGGPVPSRFTRKFGGKDVQYNSYRRDFVPFLETARNLYHLFGFRRSGGIPDTLSA
jgi:Acetyltransferase (GNAT) domain